MIKPHIYRRGDVVTIVDPQVVVRIGYPLFLGDVIEQIEQKHATAINEFIDKVGFGNNGSILALSTTSSGIDTPDYRLFLEITQALAGAHLRKVRFGGPERSIHTETNEAYRNTKGWVVVSKRMVKTGIYNSGGISYTYEGDEDFVPAHLSSERTRILLSIHSDSHALKWPTIEIEAVNVELEHIVPIVGGR